MKFNFSYSALNVYRKSPRTFYYSKILKLAPPDKTISVYGDAGNVVHKFLENHIDKVNQGKTIEEAWKAKRLDVDKGFTNAPLSLPIYKRAAELGLRKIEIYEKLGYKLSTEAKFEFEYEPGINIKGFVDVIAQKEDKAILLDWKTDSSISKGKHREQRLFYTWLYYKKYRKLPVRSIWYYIKIGKEDKDSFNLKTVLAFEKEMFDLIEEIKVKGMNIDNYPIGAVEDDPWNQYKSLMIDKAPIVKIKEKVTITIDRANLFLTGNPLTEGIKEELIGEFSYEIKDAFFVKRAMGSKGVKYDGMKKFYNARKNSLPIGFLERLTAFFKNRDIEYEIVDERANLKEYPMASGIRGIILRDYQLDAVEYVMKNKITFLEIATSGGKTAIAAEVIRRNKGLTLFIVDRGILLEQTKRELSSMLNEKIGTITEGQVDLKKINVATIQTLNSLLEKKDEYLIRILSNIKTLIIDEGHTVAAKIFIKVSKYITNANIRLGMSGTFERPDGNSMMIESVVGRNIYKINAKDLIDTNHIMKPIIWFFNLDKKPAIEAYEGYAEYYEAFIVDNEDRNKQIIKLVKQLSSKKIIIIVSKIRHGELLQAALENSVFIHGTVDKETREQWLEDIKNDKIKILIGTASIIGKGLNVPTLDVLINATGNLSSIITIQSLGRILRKSEGKSSPIYIDFIDNVRYLKQHSLERMKILREQGHEVRVLKPK